MTDKQLIYLALSAFAVSVCLLIVETFMRAAA